MLAMVSPLLLVPSPPLVPPLVPPQVPPLVLLLVPPARPAGCRACAAC
jgi:hypothetical protein